MCAFKRYYLLLSSTFHQVVYLLAGTESRCSKQSVWMIMVIESFTASFMSRCFYEPLSDLVHRLVGITLCCLPPCACPTQMTLWLWWCSALLPCSNEPSCPSWRRGAARECLTPSTNVSNTVSPLRSTRWVGCICGSGQSLNDCWGKGWVTLIDLPPPPIFKCTYKAQLLMVPWLVVQHHLILRLLSSCGVPNRNSAFYFKFNKTHHA